MAIKTKSEVMAKGQAPGGKKNLRYESFPWMRIKNKVSNSGVGVIPIGPWALNFDGQNDYVLNNPINPHVEWDRNQPWTFFANIDIGSFGSNRAIFSTRSGSIAGIVSYIDPTGILVISIVAPGQGIVLTTTAPLTLGKHTISITYDGSSAAAGVGMYIDGLLVTSNIITDNLASSIINGNNEVYLGVDGNVAIGFFDGRMKRVSFVDYVKSPAEILTDHTFGLQLQGTGNYLFASDLNQTTGIVFSNLSPALIMDINGQPFGDRVVR